MLPSSSRLSRSLFITVSGSKELQTVFNRLGTLKYTKSPENKAAIVISSKTEKRAVYRNKLRRRLYSAFGSYFKASTTSLYGILYVSKQSPTFSIDELKNLLHELLQKASK